jgi:hypothetical protein
MKNKTAVIITVTLLAIVLFAILFMFFGQSQQSKSSRQPSNPFGETDTVRTFETAATPLIPTNTFSGGTGSATGVTPPQESPTTHTGILQKLHNGPVTGFSLYSTEDAGFTEDNISYTESNTGHMFTVNLTRPTAITPLAQNTIVRNKRSIWGTDGKSTVTQYLDDNHETIYTYLYTVAHSTTTATSTTSATPTAQGRPLPTNITAVAISPDEQFLVYLTETEEGSVGHIETIATGSRSEVWRSSLTHLSVYWNTQDTIHIATHPSVHADGMVWALSPQDGTILPIITDQKGVQVLPSANTLLAYSYYDTQASLMVTRMLDTETGTVTQLPLASDVSKCAWGNRNFLYCAIPQNIHRTSYLKDVAQGFVTAGDVLWRFDITTGGAKQILVPEDESGFKMSMRDFEVSDRETFLVFREDGDDSLWRVLLPEDGWILPESTEPQTEDVVRVPPAATSTVSIDE